MARFLLLLCLSFLYSLGLCAQRPNFIGLKGGVSLPNLSAGETKNEWNRDYQSRVGPHFGAFAEWSLNKHFSLVPEINFSGQGGKRNNIQPMSIPAEYLTMFQTFFQTDKDYLFANLNNVSRINYLQVPIHLKFQKAIAFQQKMSVHIQAGPYIGYMMSAKQIVHSNSLRVFTDAAAQHEIPSNLVHNFFGTSIDTIIPAKPDLYHWNVGLSGALGFSYKVPTGKIILEAGGNYGFRYLQKGDAHGKNRIGAGFVLLGYAYALPQSNKNR